MEVQKPPHVTKRGANGVIIAHGGRFGGFADKRDSPHRALLHLGRRLLAVAAGQGWRDEAPPSHSTCPRDEDCVRRFPVPGRGRFSWIVPGPWSMSTSVKQSY
jgi:hypothetical protein